LSFSQPSGVTGEGLPCQPLLSATRLVHLQCGTTPIFRRAPLPCARHHPYWPSNLRCMTRSGERPVQARGLMRGFPSACTSPPMDKLQQPPVSQGVDFRALIRQRVRSRYESVTPRPGRCSLDLSPSEVFELDRWAYALPSSALIEETVAFRRPPPPPGGSGYRSDRTWRKLRRVSSTPCGFLTSLPTEPLSPPVMSRVLPPPSGLRRLEALCSVVPPCRSSVVKQMTQLL
jgi:hypothetical protein